MFQVFLKSVAIGCGFVSLFSGAQAWTVDCDGNNRISYADGQTFKSSSGHFFFQDGRTFLTPQGRIFYSEGNSLRTESGTLLYDSGATLRTSSGSMFYPNGATARTASGVLYRPNGTITSVPVEIQGSLSGIGSFTVTGTRSVASFVFNGSVTLGEGEVITFRIDDSGIVCTNLSDNSDGSTFLLRSRAADVSVFVKPGYNVEAVRTALKEALDSL